MSASLGNFRGAIRVAKNYTKGYTDTQTKVRDATSNDPWGPSGTQMNEIAQMTYNQGDFVEIMEMLDKRLNDKGKNWRHVFKALTVLDYCLHAGSENVVIYFKDNLYIIKTLKEFVYVDDKGKDVGHNVRQKAKDITNLLQDEDRLRAGRQQRGAMRDRMLGNIADSGLRGEEDFGARGPDSDHQRNHQNNGSGFGTSRARNEDDDLQKALMASMESSTDEERRRAQAKQEEDDLAKALRLSEEEEARRKREKEQENERALLDDSFQLHSENQYQQQQPMNTGFPLVDVGGGWNGQQLQPQYTSYNPFYAQMVAQQQQQEQMQQQQMMQQHMAMAEQQRQQEYLRQQQMMMQQQSLIPQHTAVGSNNPFAPRTGSLLEPQQTAQPSNFQNNSFLPVPQNQNQTNQSTPSPTLRPASPPKPTWQPPAKKDDGNHAGLANLLARGREDGLDTFGNQGNLRIPTGAPFHESNRMAIQQTGAGLGANNPFQKPQGQQGQQTTSDQPFFQI